MRLSQIVLSTALVLTAGTSPASSFENIVPTGVERTWIGPDFWANRLQDWRLNEGRIECLGASPNRPMRTVQLLSYTLSSEPGRLEMDVTAGLMFPAATPGPESWAGFLLGVGGSEVDYRVSALCHHWPGKDGGLFVGIDTAGKIIFRDNSQTQMSAGFKALAPETWPLLPTIDATGHGFSGGKPVPVRLRVTLAPEGDRYRITCTAQDLESNAILSSATHLTQPGEPVDGNVALVSHAGASTKGANHWFQDWRAAGSKLVACPERANGPVLSAMHTISRGVLKLTAQFPPIGAADTQSARLEISDTQAGAWTQAAEASIDPESYTATFRVEAWDASMEKRYRIAYALRTCALDAEAVYYEGRFRAEPAPGKPLVLAAFTGDKNYTGTPIQWNNQAIWFPHAELVRAVAHHQPDMLFFSGDQIYEGDLTGVVRDPLDSAMLDYLDKWYRWCWAFKDLVSDVPCVAIPDDHDVYHGNIWGAGGRKAEKADDGGYTMPAAFVNMVQRTQTSHLPDPFNPTPVEQGISVYYTSLNYGGVDFAILEDRKWKSSPTVAVPEGNVVNGFFLNKDFDPATQADVPGAVLLGERQEKFLEDWAADWEASTYMKSAISQTAFANVCTLPPDFDSDKGTPEIPPLPPGEYPEGYKPATDADSNGWPQTPRDNAVRLLRKAFANHVAGDQHLAFVVRYGVDSWNDAGYGFCVPSIGNTWPRRFFPSEPGKNRAPGAPKYTGEFRDGFGNEMTVHAVANPYITGIEPADLNDRTPGYGIVRYDKQARTIVMECWPRWVDPAAPDATQYPGWPITITQEDNFAPKAAPRLPHLVFQGVTNPLVRIERSGEEGPVYTVRARGNSFVPPVLTGGAYRAIITDLDTGKTTTLEDLNPSGNKSAIIVIL